jgi:DNA gyrase subunit A
VVGVVALDPRILPEPIPAADADPELFAGDGAPPEDGLVGPFVVGVSSDGLAVRMTLDNFEEPSNKNGRTYQRVRKGERVVAAALSKGDENVCLASKEGRGLVFPVQQIPVFKSAAKGVIAMRLQGTDDRVLGMAVTTAARDGLEVVTSRGRKETVRTTKFEVTNRGGKGRTIIQRGTLKSAQPEPVEVHLNGRG